MGLAFTPASMENSWHLAAIKIDSMINPTPTRGTGVPYFQRIVFLISAAVIANFFSAINFVSHVAR